MSSLNTTSNVKKAALSLGAIILLSTLGAAPAMAKACKDVHIEAKNLTNKHIPITDLDYWDSESGKWRSEPVPNTPLSNNRTWQINRNLERVNGQPVKVKVKYKYRAKKKYSKLLKRWTYKTVRKTHTSTSKLCERDSEFVMQLR